MNETISEFDLEEMIEALGDSIEMEGRWDEGDEMDLEETCKNLINKGYGNVQKAVREFVEKLKSLAGRNHHYVTRKDIDILYREMYRE